MKCFPDVKGAVDERVDEGIWHAEEEDRRLQVVPELERYACKLLIADFWLMLFFKILFNQVVTSNSEIFYLVLCQSKRDDDHRRVVGDPANQEAAHDEERHLRGKVK